MLISLILLVLCLAVVIKSADFAIHFSTKIASSFNLSKYVIGFLVVAVISILPETLISVTSAFEGVPSFGLGTLYGSNVADLTLVMAIVVFISQKNLKVESRIIKNSFLHIGVISVPVILGLDGHYSRIEGLTLIVLGLSFYLYVLRGAGIKKSSQTEGFLKKDVFFLVLSLAVLLIAADLTVKSGLSLASHLGVSPVYIGMFIVGVGTTLPELIFSVRAAKNKHDGLALGDILGTVVADATIVVGIMALISPFLFDYRLVYVTGVFMILAMTILFHFMRSGKTLNKKEAFFLLLFYTCFVFVESLINRIK